MAIHSSILAWRIPGTGEFGGLPSMGSHSQTRLKRLSSSTSSIVGEAEVGFFWNSLDFSMIQWMLAIWSLVPLPFLNPSWTSGSSQFTYCWSFNLENFDHYFVSVWDECNWNCAVVWTFFGTAFLWDGNENWNFSSPVATGSSHSLAY